jgi:Fatty acid synthesis protein
LRTALDPFEIGGAPLLGTDGIAIIAHGASNSKAIKNAIRVANEALRQDINRQILESLHALPEMTLPDLKRSRKFWSQLRERFRHPRDTHDLQPPGPAEEENKE